MKDGVLENVGSSEALREAKLGEAGGGCEGRRWGDHLGVEGPVWPWSLTHWEGNYPHQRLPIGGYTGVTFPCLSFFFSGSQF